MSKGSVGLIIKRIGKVIKIWDEVLFKLRMPFDGMVTMKKILFYYSHCMDTYIDVVVEVIEVHISVAFDFYLDEDFIEFW